MAIDFGQIHKVYHPYKITANVVKNFNPRFPDIKIRK